MNLLAWSAAVLGLLVYIPTTYQVWRGKMVLNLATFILWGLLDAIAAASIYAKGGNWTLPAVYVLGVGMVIVSMVKARSFKWGTLETVTAILVGISLVVWYVAGPVMATVVSSLSVLIASIPQIWDASRKPEETTAWVWFSYLVVNVLSVAAGKDWSISERFYPGACTLMTALMVVLCMRKYMRSSPTTK